jgi:hypothetical protein
MARSTALVFLGLIVSTSMNYRTNAHEPIKSLPVNEASDNSQFVVHEWGTFTTFSGSDGVFLDFRPLDAKDNDLPSYVFDRGSFAKNPARPLSKSRLLGRVRMETPVIYFYTDRIRSVDVSVEFADGLLTEFYPPVRELRPAIDEENIFGRGEDLGKSSLNWGTIDLIPTSQLVPNLEDANVREVVATNIVHGLVPHAANEQHYAAARDTDAALVHFRDNSNTTSYFEKFLFYRGVGKFQLPISTLFNGESVVLRNSSSLSIHSAVLIDVEGTTIQATQIDDIEPGQSLPFSDLQSVSREQLAEMVQKCLVSKGLYAKEAAAMVATWQQSWFTENGLRVLYLVPASITDSLLPLHITPPPQETLRVLVGRMEIMSPTSEKEMATFVAQSATSRAKHYARQQKQGTNSPYAFPEKIYGYGRMTEPALARVASIARDDSIRNEAELLINELQSYKEASGQ